MSNTLFTGKVYLRFDELASTNDYARDLIAKSKPAEGTVIRADTQSAGRGQFGSKWLSAPGENLTLSLILYPNWLRAADQFRLSEAVALALHDCVRHLLPLPHTVNIKWPNDLYIGDRKVAGVLIQNALKGVFLQSSIVGIGLNVNQTRFPAEVPNATSLALAAGHTFDLDEVAGMLFECLEQRYLQLRSAQAEALRDAYHACLLGMGEARQFADAGGHVFSGEILGVADDGRLRIRTATGDALFAVKEVQMV